MSTFIRARTAESRPKFAALLLGGLAGVMALGVATAAGADRDLPSVVVKYSQESLSNDAGVSDLYRRIRSAAKQVCPDASSRDLALQQRAKECRAHAVAAAIRQIDNSRLAALHAVRSKNG